MIVKKFQAPTEMEAIVKAREELGSAAVVLNIKTIKQRGFARLFKKDVVEVTAALEEKDITDGINKSRPTFDNSLNSQQESAVHMINQSMVSNGSTSSINLVADDDISVTSASAIEQKLDSLHNLLQNQGSAASSFNRSQPGNVPDRTGIQQDYRSAQAPAAVKTSIYAINLLNEASLESGGPDNIAVTVEKPTLETSNIMMKHKDIHLIAATGGPGVVTAVLSSGKRGIGAGAGNPPALVDDTADIRKAAQDIVNGCTFDNNLPCIAEKEVIAVDQIADYLIFNMKNNGAYEVKDPEIIEKMVDLVTKDRKKPAVNFVGKSAQYILDKVGIKVGPEVKCIIMEAPKDHPFVQIELMMPILPIVRVPNVDEAIDFAVEVEHGNRHTAMMHSKNVDKLTKMAKEIETTIFVKNGPSYAGIGVGGMGYTTFTIAGPTGEGLTSAKSFCRKRRCVLQDGLHIRMK